MIGPKRLEEAVEKASTAFWVEVEKQFPEISADNLDHGTVIVLQWQMKEAIERWIQQNLEDMENSNGN
jgi:hypothetical protein